MYTEYIQCIQPEKKCNIFVWKILPWVQEVLFFGMQAVKP